MARVDERPRYVSQAQDKLSLIVSCLCNSGGLIGPEGFKRKKTMRGRVNDAYFSKLYVPGKGFFSNAGNMPNDIADSVYLEKAWRTTFTSTVTQMMTRAGLW